MTIDLKCCCGAYFHFEDVNRTFIRMGGDRDEKGRKYLVEKLGDDWTDLHKNCIAKFQTINTK